MQELYVSLVFCFNYRDSWKNIENTLENLWNLLRWVNLIEQTKVKQR